MLTVRQVLSYAGEQGAGYKGNDGDSYDECFRRRDGAVNNYEVYKKWMIGKH